MDLFRLAVAAIWNIMLSSRVFSFLRRLSSTLSSSQVTATRTDPGTGGAPPPGVQHSNSSWRIRSYDGPSALSLEEWTGAAAAAAAVLRSPDDVLVEVHSSSVNPLDVAMTGGYGSAIFGLMRSAASAAASSSSSSSALREGSDGEFPLTLGRDFSGVVVSCGSAAARRFEPGQEVWGLVAPNAEDGAHAKYVITSQSMVSM